MYSPPLFFNWSVSLPNKNIENITFTKNDSGKEIKQKISCETPYSHVDMKVFFGEKEICDEERFFDLLPLGFVLISNLRVEIPNGFDVIVELTNGKKIDLNVGPHTQIHSIIRESEKQISLPLKLSALIKGGKELCPLRTLDELDINEGTVLIQQLNPLADIFIKQDSLTSSPILSMIEYVKHISVSELRSICQEEFFKKNEKVFIKYMNNPEISHSIITFLSQLLYSSALQTPYFDQNYFFNFCNNTLIVKILEAEIDNLSRNERRVGSLSVKEKEILLSYSFVMKGENIREERVNYIVECVMEMIEECVKKGDEYDIGKKGATALSCVCASLSFNPFPIKLFFTFSFFFFFYFVVYREHRSNEKRIYFEKIK
jgi:hypothetical protein